jgi:hypothetical protein
MQQHGGEPWPTFMVPTKEENVCCLFVFTFYFHFFIGRWLGTCFCITNEEEQEVIHIKGKEDGNKSKNRGSSFEGLFDLLVVYL